MNVTLFGKVVFADVIKFKDHEIKRPSGIGLGESKSDEKCPYQRHGVMHPQAKNNPGPPEDRKNKEKIFPRAF